MHRHAHPFQVKIVRCQSEPFEKDRERERCSLLKENGQMMQIITYLIIKIIEGNIIYPYSMEEILKLYKGNYEDLTIKQETISEPLTNLKRNDT